MDQIQTAHRQEQRRGCKMPLNFKRLVLELVLEIGIRSGGDCDIFNTGLDGPYWDWIFGFGVVDGGFGVVDQRGVVVDGEF
ncbi:hypothetical protein SO802_020540 [Lithocarpus litseifolius]|uniref:Uncharacterized protein n=1 Tax=Lithocarpus litseifolius TaxID=425828 RepID=A0AAW2CGA8_9ROSI